MFFLLRSAENDLKMHQKGIRIFNRVKKKKMNIFFETARSEPRDDGRLHIGVMRLHDGEGIAGGGEREQTNRECD